MKKVQAPKFVLFMLDEMSDNQCKYQLSAFLHYISDSKICKQVLGFTDVSSDRTSDSLCKHIVQQVIKRWNYF